MSLFRLIAWGQSITLELVRPLFPVERIEHSVYVLWGVAFVICQDQIDELWRDVVKSWHDCGDVLYAVSFFRTIDHTRREKLSVGQRVNRMEWCELVYGAEHEDWNRMSFGSMSDHKSSSLGNDATSCHNTVGSYNHFIDF